MAQIDNEASRTGATGVQGWFIDVPRNSVVVTVSIGATDPGTVAVTRLAESLGDSVIVEERPVSQAPHTTAALAGGFEFLQADRAHVCSVGFNTRDAYNRNVVLTAGHCTRQAGWSSRGNYSIDQESDLELSGGRFRDVRERIPELLAAVAVRLRARTTPYARLAGRWDNPPVGATVCKSGRTTGYTCGRIIATNQAVRYPEGVTYGLTQHNACVEGGDSGGSNISASYYALGVTSGAGARSRTALPQ